MSDTSGMILCSPTERGEHMNRSALFDVLVAQETDDCVLWPNPKSNGYGQVGRRGMAHSLALEQRVGPRPEGHVACHSPQPGGHARNCMNYRHLRWDTQKANIQDKFADGTMPLGEDHHNAQLGVGDVLAIRRWHADRDASSRQLAEQFCVSQALIMSVIHRRVWAWLT